MFQTDLPSIFRSLNTVYTATGICYSSYVDCLLARSGRNCSILTFTLRIHKHTVSSRAMFTFTSSYEQCVLSGTVCVGTKMQTLSQFRLSFCFTRRCDSVFRIQKENMNEIVGLLCGRWRGLDICNVSLNFPLWLQGKERTRTLLPGFCSYVICLHVCQNAEYRQHIHAAHQRRMQIKSDLNSYVCLIVHGVLCVCVCVFLCIPLAAFHARIPGHHYHK